MIDNHQPAAPPEPPTFDMTTIRPFYETATVDEAALPNAAVALPENLTHITRETKRTAVELVRSRSAKATISRLPEPGESLHCILRGDFALFDFIPAILELADEPIDELRIVTLSLASRNIERLAEWVQAGRIKRISFIVSCYFAAADSKIMDHATEFCREHGFPLVPLRSHAKLLAVAVGRHRLIVESSANLRSCKNVENAVLYDDDGLYRFHTAWIDSLIEKGRDK